MKRLLVENLSENLVAIQKMDFEHVDSVFDVLCHVFHPEGVGNNDPDERFLALWKMFLVSVGWNEDDYWEEVDFRKDDCICPKCKEEQEKADGLEKDKKVN